MGAALNSCLYDCNVVHKRLVPSQHEFCYRLFYFDVDLDELPELNRKVKLMGWKPWSLYRILAKDHIDLGKAEIRSNLKEWLHDHGVELRSDDKVRLLTMPRVLGYIFNPVCFYSIFSKDGTPRHVVVEVCNTFRELKGWLISDCDSHGRFQLRAPKNFYVSPFSKLQAEFDFQIKIPDESLKIHIDNVEDDQTTLVSWIHGERKPLSDWRLLWYSVRFPLLGLVVIFRIHWQALRLWMKKIPYYKKHLNRDLQTDLYRPHSSISDPIKDKS